MVGKAHIARSFTSALEYAKWIQPSWTVWRMLLFTSNMSKTYFKTTSLSSSQNPKPEFELHANWETLQFWALKYLQIVGSLKQHRLICQEALNLLLQVADWGCIDLLCMNWELFEQRLWLQACMNWRLLGPSMCCFTKTLVFQNWADSLWSLTLSSSAFFQYMAWAYWASPLHLLHLFTQISGAVQQLFSLPVWSHALPTFVEALWCLHPKLAFWTASSDGRAAIVLLLHVPELRPSH